MAAGLAGDDAAGYSGDGDPATTARFDSPQGVAADSSGNLYVADTINCTIRRIVISTAAVTTVAGAPTIRGLADGSVGVATFDQPFGVTTVGTDLYVADTQNHTIRRIH